MFTWFRLHGWLCLCVSVPSPGFAVVARQTLAATAELGILFVSYISSETSSESRREQQPHFSGALNRLMEMMSGPGTTVAVSSSKPDAKPEVELPATL